MWPDLELIGWYSAKSNSAEDESGDKPTDDDIAQLTGGISELCENPLMMIMNK